MLKDITLLAKYLRNPLVVVILVVGGCIGEDLLRKIADGVWLFGH